MEIRSLFFMCFLGSRFEDFIRMCWVRYVFIYKIIFYKVFIEDRIFIGRVFLFLIVKMNCC